MPIKKKTSIRLQFGLRLTGAPEGPPSLKEELYSVMSRKLCDTVPGTLLIFNSNYI